MTPSSGSSIARRLSELALHEHGKRMASRAPCLVPALARATAAVARGGGGAKRGARARGAADGEQLAHAARCSAAARIAATAPKVVARKRKIEGAPGGSGASEAHASEGPLVIKPDLAS